MISVSIPEVLWIASIILTMLPLSIYIFKYPKFREYLHLHLTGVMLTISLAFDCIGFYFVKKHIHTTFLYNVYDLLQFIILSWFYYDISFKKTDEIKNQTKAIFVSGTTFYLLTLIAISFLYQNPVTQHQNLMWTISSMILIIYGFMYFNDLVVTLPLRKNMHIDSLFLINAGLIYFFVFTLLLFFMQEYILKNLHPDTYKLIWSYNSLNNIIKNVLIAIGLGFFPVSKNRL